MIYNYNGNFKITQLIGIGNITSVTVKQNYNYLNNLVYTNFHKFVIIMTIYIESWMLTFAYSFKHFWPGPPLRESYAVKEHKYYLDIRMYISSCRIVMSSLNGMRWLCHTKIGPHYVLSPRTIYGWMESPPGHPWRHAQSPSCMTMCSIHGLAGWSLQALMWQKTHIIL